MLVVIVVTCNIIITILNFYLIWKIYQLRKCLSCYADILVDLEENLAILFRESPSSILEVSREIYRLRDNHKIWEKYSDRIKKSLIILRLIYRLYQKKLR